MMTTAPQVIRLVNEVAVSDRPTHIVIYQEMQQEDKFAKLQSLVEKLVQRVTVLEMELARREVRPSPYFSSSIAPEPAGLEVIRPSDPKTIFNSLVSQHSAPMPTMSLEATDMKEGVDFEADAEEENTEDVPEDGEEEGDADGEEEEEEDNPLRLKEFEYGDRTLYRDADDLVYQRGDDGDLDDEPIGIWSEEHQTVFFELTYKDNTYYMDDEDAVYSQMEDGGVGECVGRWSDEHEKIVQKITYKDTDYYRDEENQVYACDAEGAVGSVVGIWSPEKNKVLKYK